MTSFFTQRAVARRATLALAAAAVIAAPAHAQRASFTPTLYWDTGLIDTPAAWVSPLGSDLAINFTGIKMDSTVRWGTRQSPAQGFNFSISGSFWGRAEGGVSIFSSSLKGALFAKALIWDQQDGAFRKGIVHWMPSVAVGLRNVGYTGELTRWAEPDTPGFETGNTMYAVATRTFALGEAVEHGARAKTQFTLNAGVGNGLFVNEGSAGKAYAKSTLGGKFAGAKLDFATGRYSTLSVMAEHNGFDVNAGAVLDLGGPRIGVYLLEMGAAKSATSWSYSKVAVTFGWQTNLLALVRGNRMGERIAEIERERDALVADIRSREANVQSLEARLRSVEGATEADRRAQRELLEQKLKEEQEALKRLQERLNARKKPE